jgi:hypothetical protein
MEWPKDVVLNLIEVILLLPPPIITIIIIIDSLQKTAILGTSHIIRKVLLAET